VTVQPLVNPWLGMGIVIVAAGALLGSLRLFQSLRGPSPELVRKLFHIGGGLTALTLPWLFDSPWPVLFLMAGLLLLLVSMRRVGALRHSVGQVVHGVDRDSRGELYFPVAIAAVFVLAQGDAVVYIIPVLVLTFADSLAALIGVEYGHRRYTTSEGWKSAEGSIAFFLTTFFCVHTPLLLLTGTERAKTLVIAVILGLLVMLLEAIAWHGLDNLLIPLITFALLKAFLNTSLDVLLVDLGITILMAAFIFVWRSRTTLNDSALMGAVLAGYLCWTLGGPAWVVPPLLLFATYAMFWPRTDLDRLHVHTFAGVLSVASTAVVWLAVARYLPAADLYYPFTLGFGCHLAMIGLAGQKFSAPNTSGARLVAVNVARAWLIIFTPFLFLNGLSGLTLVYAGIAVPAMVVCTLSFFAIQPGLDHHQEGDARWWRQGACGLGASAAGLAVILAT
jgi:phytol kinase